MTISSTAAGMPDERAQELLGEALRYLQQNSVPEAELRLGTVLDGRPEDPDALQLLGVIRRMQGRNSEAEELYRRSLATKPDQPQVHHNLGNLYRSVGRLDEAIEHQQEAVRLKPGYAEAHLSLGLALYDKRNLSASEKSIRRALYIQPNLEIAKQSLAVVLNDGGRATEAEVVLRHAIAAGSRNPRQIAAFEHNLGVSMQLQNRHNEALQLFDAAQSKVPEIPLTDYNRGNSLQALGKLEAAVSSYRRAIERDPLDVRAHNELNHLLYRLGDDESFLNSYETAAARYPEVGGLPLDKANFLLQIGDYEGARAGFERAAPLLPGNVAPSDGLGLVLARLGEYPEAIHAHEAALKMEPQNADVWRNYAETLLRSGDALKSVEAAERALALQPHHQGALAILSTAFAILDDGRAEVLGDYERLVRIYEIDPPEGYTDMASFNRDLNAYLDNLHRDKRHAATQSLRGGTQTLDNLFGRGHDLVDRLRTRIDEAVSSYIAEMGASQSHPLLPRRRNGFGFSASWSSRLHDSGYHTNHFHPKGWISSAYYVEVPEAVQEAAGRQGWLNFGEPPFETALKEPIQRAIQPRVGTLVLFPSYVWHGTAPFHSKQARTTIAFDVVPE